MEFPFSETPEKALIRQKLTSLHTATSALWMESDGKHLHPEIATVISEWTIGKLEELILEIRKDIELARATHGKPGKIS